MHHTQHSVGRYMSIATAEAAADKYAQVAGELDAWDAAVTRRAAELLADKTGRFYPFSHENFFCEEIVLGNQELVTKALQLWGGDDNQPVADQARAYKTLRKVVWDYWAKEAETEAARQLLDADEDC